MVYAGSEEFDVDVARPASDPLMEVDENLNNLWELDEVIELAIEEEEAA